MNLQSESRLLKAFVTNLTEPCADSDNWPMALQVTREELTESANLV